MKKIIVPIDFSDCSKNALRNAIPLAERLHMELVVYHSLVIPVGFSEGVVSAIEVSLESMENTAREDIEKLMAEFPEMDKVNHNYEVQYGSLHDNLSKMTEEMDVAFVVMGSHGASGLKKVFLGSNAYNVMKDLNCPVITIPEDQDLSKMKHIAFAMDCHDIPNHDILVTVVDLARAFFAELHLVHIDNNQVEQKRQMEVARSLDKYLKSISHKFHFIHNEEVEKGLEKFSNTHRIDLLMLVAKHHGFIDRLRHGSHTRRLMLDMPMPLMVFHE